MDVMVYTRLLHESLAQRDTDTRELLWRIPDIFVDSKKQNISCIFREKVI